MGRPTSRPPLPPEEVILRGQSRLQQPDVAWRDTAPANASIRWGWYQAGMVAAVLTMIGAAALLW